VIYNDDSVKKKAISVLEMAQLINSSIA